MGVLSPCVFLCSTLGAEIPWIDSSKQGMFPALGQGGVYFPSASQIKHMAWCNIGGGGQGEPSAGYWAGQLIRAWLPKAAGCAVEHRLPRAGRGAARWPRRFPFLNWWHSPALPWVGGCLQHWGLKPALPMPASMNLGSCCLWWHPELTLPSFLFSPGNML